jgi:hypothetical protein
MDALLKLLVSDRLTETEARVLRQALEDYVEKEERWCQIFADDFVAMEDLRVAWGLQAKLFVQERPRPEAAKETL